MLVHTMSWADARQQKVDGSDWEHDGEVPMQGPGTRRNTSTEVDGAYQSNEPVEGGKATSSESRVVTNGVDVESELGIGIEMCQDDGRKTERVGVNHTEQEVVTWDDDHGSVMVGCDSLHWGAARDTPFVGDLLVRRNAEEASMVDFAWAACRLDRYQSLTMMTSVSTWPLVSLPGQLKWTRSSTRSYAKPPSSCHNLWSVFLLLSLSFPSAFPSSYSLAASFPSSLLHIVVFGEAPFPTGRVSVANDPLISTVDMR